jgi:D-alanyl-D-alanine carboxypeptidase/D-alanyl-D-alanine-endopeptidase (penicillin-binding protein 4)
VFLTLGAERYEAPGDLDKSRRVIRSWLASRRLPSHGLFMDNGAGLSRDTRLSAELIGRLLRDAYFDPYMPEFISSMSIIGVDGTMRKRLKKTDLVGRGHFKTGSLEEVKALAGYLLDRKGRRWVVVLLINDERADWRVNKVQDALLEWLYERA